MNQKNLMNQKDIPRTTLWARDWRALALTQVHHGSRLSDSCEDNQKNFTTNSLAHDTVGTGLRALALTQVHHNQKNFRGVLEMRKNGTENLFVCLRTEQFGVAAPHIANHLEYVLFSMFVTM